MTIAVGDKIPSLTLKYLAEDGLKEISTDTLFGDKKSVLFSVPGAFTPTCSMKHLPGFVSRADELKEKGVDKIVCIAVNDPFVMRAWGEKSNVGDAVFLLPDGNAEFTKALGLEFDGSGFGLGIRGQRFALVIEGGIVTDVQIEKPGAFEVSSAEAILKRL